MDDTKVSAPKFAFQDRSNVMLKKVAARSGKGTPMKPLKARGGMALAKSHDELLFRKKAKGLEPLKIAVNSENSATADDLLVQVEQTISGSSLVNDENLPQPERMHVPNEREWDFVSTLPDFEQEQKVIHEDIFDEPSDSPYNPKSYKPISMDFNVNWNI